MIQNSIKHKLALVGACLLTFMSAQAQTADGTVFISGQVSANTCKLSISDTNGSTNNGTRSIQLGTVAPPGGTITPGTLLGTLKQVAFALRNATDTGTCAISGTPASWNLVLDLQANQVDSSIPSKPFLTNQATTNAASNIGVVLFDTNGSQFSSILTGAGYGGTRLTNSNTGRDELTAMSMGFQFVTTSTTAPTAGLFSATVPLLIVYN